jgi:hypothetical protein
VTEVSSSRYTNAKVLLVGESGVGKTGLAILQLKSGDSHLKKRKENKSEIFTIKNLQRVAYWQQQAYPVMLVIRTSDSTIRWMDVSEYLRRESRGGKRIKQIVFEGKPFTAPNILKMRDELLGHPQL